jgi:trehalose/maltose hydrolase-like predicted phosphorylase
LLRRLLEKHELAASMLAVINGYLGDRGLSLRQGTIGNLQNPGFRVTLASPCVAADRKLTQ